MVLVVFLLEDLGVDVVVDVGADEVARLKLLLLIVSKLVKLPLVTLIIRFLQIQPLMVRKRATLFM